MKKKRQSFTVKYSIKYPSGKLFTTQNTVYALSEYGAKCYISYLRGNEIIFHSIESNGFVGEPILEDRSVIGNF